MSDKPNLEKTEPAPEQDGLSLQDAGDIIALIDRLVERGGVKGEETLRVGQIRTKLQILIKSASEQK